MGVLKKIHEFGKRNRIVSYDEMRRIEGVIRAFEREKTELKRITAYVASI
jgi:hypothetical protein